MEGMINIKKRLGRPPLALPPLSRAPSALVTGPLMPMPMPMPMPSQLGSWQPQLMMMAMARGGASGPGGGGDCIPLPFPQGLSCSIDPQKESEHPENNPFSGSDDVVVSASTGCIGSGLVISPGTESMTVSKARWGKQPHPEMDERRFRRLLSNRVSAQKSRLRRTKYVNELENRAKELEAKIAILSPEVMKYQGKKHQLQMENDLMKQKNAVLEQRITVKNEIATNYNREVGRLKDHFRLQQKEIEEELLLCAAAAMTNNENMCQGCPNSQILENSNMVQPTGWNSEQYSQNLGISSVPLPDQLNMNMNMASQAFQLANSQAKGV